MQSADTLSFVIDKHMEVFAIKQLLFSGSGNFRRAVETALQARQLAVGMRDVSLPVVITAALLHAAGKADD